MQSEKSNAGFIKIEFDYKYNIGVPSDFYCVVDLGDDIASVNVSKREGVEIYDKGSIQREVGGQGSDLTLENPENLLLGTKLKVVFESSIFSAESGSHGKVIHPWFFSSIAVFFVTEDVNVIDSDEIIDLTQKIFNKFLSAYRHSSMDVRNRYLEGKLDPILCCKISKCTLDKSELEKPKDELLLREVLERQEFVPYNSCESDNSLFLVNFRSQNMTDTPSVLLDEQQILNLENNTKNVKEIPAYRAMFLRGMERLLYGDYNSAILNFDTAAEMSIIYHLTEILKNNGRTLKDIVALFDESLESSRKSKKRYITTRERLTRLQEEINVIRQEKEMHKIDLKSLNEYKDYLTNVRSIRNRIAHAGESFEESVAKDAFTYTQGYFIKIESIYKESKK